jgi:hypothetical protein
VVALVVRIETGSGAAFNAVNGCDGLCYAGAGSGSAADFMVALVVRIKIGRRACQNTGSCSNTGDCASAGNGDKSAACRQPGSKRFSRDSCGSRSVRRAYP